jgi:hypothetical protein
MLDANRNMQNRIFDYEPADWQQLEEMVNTAFTEMGYESYRNHTVDTIRGKVEIDVFATDCRTSIPTTVICECKHWNKPVDQQVIYAFRSICSDIGPHYALVISKKGFQSGANETRNSTNVHLLNFAQFQEKFFSKWREGVFMEIVRMRDCFLPALYRETAMFDKAFKKYALFEKVSEYFIMNKSLPISVVDPRGDIDILNEIEINSHRHFFSIAKEAYEELC